MKAKAKASSARATRQAARPAPAGRDAARPNTRRPPAPRAAKAPVAPQPALGLDPGPAPGLDPGVARNGAALRHLGGSQSDEWNDLIAAETVRARCVTDRPIEAGDIDAVVAGLAGLAPQDEFEGMMAAQLIAGHGALMECYARAALGAEREESLRQAARLSRAFVQVMGALKRHRTPSRPAARAPQDDVPLGSRRHPEERAKPASKGAKQPHAQDIAHLAPRLERLRRDYATREPLEPLSEEELADFAEDGFLLEVMMQREPHGRSTALPRPLTGDDVYPLTDAELEVMADVRERLPFTDPLAVEQAIVAAAAARAKSAEQPHAAPAADQPENDGSEKSAKQPHAVPAIPPRAPAEMAAGGAAVPRGSLREHLGMTDSVEGSRHPEERAEPASKGAKQPRATLTLGEALRSAQAGPLDARKFNELYLALPPGERDAFLEAVNARAREVIHGKRPMEFG
jgi:hypothetical protein